jgi:hypothetical protein
MPLQGNVSCYSKSDERDERTTYKGAYSLDKNVPVYPLLSLSAFIALNFAAPDYPIDKIRAKLCEFP